MAGRPRQPIDLLVMNGKSHLGKDEIEERRAAEVTAPFTKIEPPDCLSKKQKNRFNYIARQLADIGLYADIDSESLGRYIIAEETLQKIRKRLKKEMAFEQYEKTLNLQAKYLKICQQFAADFGMTVSSRCKLIIPRKPKEPANKFDLFDADERGDESAG